MLSKRITAAAIVLIAAAPFVVAVSAGVRKLPTPTKAQADLRAAGAGLGSVLKSQTGEVIGEGVWSDNSTGTIVLRLPNPAPTPGPGPTPPSPATRTR